MKKSVTVIVPTIGRPEYIKNTIDSILGQDYGDIEILISDNFPDTPTKLILGELLDSRIKIIERDRRYEFCEHMNLCLSDARGHFVMILSDDDLISPDYISCMVGLLNENSDVMVGLGRQKILSENDGSLGSIECGEESDWIDGIEFTLNHFRGKQNFPVITYLSLFARKDDLLAAGGFREYPDGSNADNYLFYSLAVKGKVGLSSSVLGYRVYLTSFGLSTPFEKLYRATLAYDKDMSNLVWNLTSKPVRQKMNLRLLIKIASVRLMKNRLLRIYKARIGRLATAMQLMRILVCFLPVNMFFRVGSVKQK